MAKQEVPCLYCSESFEFVSGTHLKRQDHFSDSNAFERYKKWVADEYDIDRSHEVFHTPGALTRPEDFERYEHLFK